MKITRLPLLSLLMIAGLLLTSCGEKTSTDTVVPQTTNTEMSSDTNEAAPVPAAGGVLTIDPANTTDEKAMIAAGYLYESLVRLQDGVVVGALAESFSVSDDGLDYIFNLRPGVVFHDGSVLNADVVVANFTRWFDPKDANRGSGKFAAWTENFGGFKNETKEGGKPKSQYDGIEKVDELTVLVHLNTPDPEFTTKLTNLAFSIVSPKSFSSGDGGSGPYKTSAVSDSSLTLEPFAGYWDASAIPDKNMEIPLK